MRIEINLTEARTSSKPSDGKGKKIKQVASKVSSNPFSSGKIKKKKKINRRRLSALLARRLDISRRIARLT